MPSAPFISNEDVVEQIRLQIVAGELAPGQRLPPREELRLRFNTTNATIQRAFDRLMQDGFVRSDGRRGTFVTEFPPHLTRYALAFGERPEDGWSPFSELLRTESARLERLYGIELPHYFAVNFHRDSPDYKRLVDDVANRCIAGLIFVGSYAHVKDSPLGLNSGVPRVSLTAVPQDNSVAHVATDYSSFVNRALERLAATGKRRVALLASSAILGLHKNDFEQGLARYGLESFPFWVQPVTLREPEIVRGVVSLLMNPHQTVRPDSLILANDQFADYGVAALLEQGLRIPQDVEVIAHANFPKAHPAVVPVHRLGFDVATVLQSCLTALNRQRESEELHAGEICFAPAQFEDEIVQSGWGRG